MMAQAAPLLLLLLWLLMGSQGQVTQVKYQEGQTLRVSCSYRPQIPEKRWKLWCKQTDNGRWCNSLITRKPDFTEQVWDPRASLEDDTYSNTIIITMSNLIVKDSGIYRCGFYDFVHSTLVVLRTFRLEVSPVAKGKRQKPSRATTETPRTTPATPLINSRSPVIQVLCGLIVTKGLVFTALVVLLNRGRGPGKGRSQSELSQYQNGLS